MNPHDKYRLRFNRVDLVENINPVDPVLDFLIGKETITPDMAEEIKAETTNQDRVARLLNMLEKRGPVAFYHFREALIQQDAYEHLVHRLDNTDITKMPQSRTERDETDAQAFPSRAKSEPKTGPFTYTSTPPQSARIHSPHASTSGGATGTARTAQRGYQSSVTVTGNNNFVIMGGKNSKINFY